VLPTFPSNNPQTDFHETWYEHHANTAELSYFATDNTQSVSQSVLALSHSVIPDQIFVEVRQLWG